MASRRKKIVLGTALLLAVGVCTTVALLFKDRLLEDRYIRMLSSEDEATMRFAAERLVEMKSARGLPALIRTIDWKGEFRDWLEFCCNSGGYLEVDTVFDEWNRFKGGARRLGH